MTDHLGGVSLATLLVVSVSTDETQAVESNSAVIIDNFESGGLSDWTIRYGNWEIVDPGHSSSFALRSTVGAGNEYRIDHNTFTASFGRYSYDVFFEGADARDGDLFIQVLDHCNYLWLQIAPAGSDNILDRVQLVHSGVTTIGCTPIHLAQEAWHTVVLERYPNGVIRVFTDGNLVIETFNGTLNESGGVALRAFDSGVLYDNISFDPSLPPEPAPPAPSSCQQFGWTIPDSALCEACGNGSCEGGENCCNCPDDCAGGCEEGVCIPTISEWGMVVMGLLLLTAGTLVWHRRRLASP